jgi:hypothetical protein
MRRIAIALVLAGTFAAPPVHADATLPQRCQKWSEEVVALVCDPRAGSGAGFGILAEGAASGGEPGLGVARLASTEPFQDGDRIAFSLAGGSARTYVAFRAAAGGYTRPVVVAPFTPPASRYDVEIRDGAAVVSADTGQTKTFPLGPPPIRHLPSRTPGEAIRSFARLIGSHPPDLRSACELLSPSARELLGAYTGCDVGLDFPLFYSEDEPAPDLVSLRVERVRLLRGSPTMARVRLDFRFRPRMRGDRRRAVVLGTVPLVHEARGWRIALPDAFSAVDAALNGATLVKPADVRARLRDYQQGLRSIRTSERRERLARRRIQVGDTTCSGEAAMLDDPARDVLVNDGRFRARRQDGSHADLIGAAHARHRASMCFSMQFREPVPDRVFLELDAGGSEIDVDVRGETAVGSKGDDEPRYFPAQVTISPARDSLRVEAATRWWPSIDVLHRRGWSAAAYVPSAAREVAYYDRAPNDE